VSGQTTIGGSNFTVKTTSTSDASQRDSGDAATYQAVVKRNSVPSLQVDMHMSSRGAVQIHMLLGDGFRGARELSLASEDRKMLHGTVDGRAIAPFPVDAKPESVKLADGTALPVLTIDDDVKHAIPALMQTVKGQCSAAAPPVPTRLALLPSPDDGDPPGHFSDTVASAGCIAC